MAGSMTGEMARRLVALRKERGWSLRMAAERTGISHEQIRVLEQGSYSPSLATLSKLAAGYGIALDDLAGLSSFESEQLDAEAAEMIRTVRRLASADRVELWMFVRFLEWRAAQGAVPEVKAAGGRKRSDRKAAG